jgi:hypothetical protein
MKLKVLFLALFVAGIAASFAVAKPPPGKGNNGGNGKGNGRNAVTAPATTTGVSTAAAATLPTSGKVILCHKTGQATQWVRISVAAQAAKQRIAKGDVWLQDPAGTCVGATVKDREHGSTTTAAATTAATTTAATTTVATTTAATTVATTTTAP